MLKQLVVIMTTVLVVCISSLVAQAQTQPSHATKVVAPAVVIEVAVAAPVQASAPIVVQHDVVLKMATLKVDITHASVRLKTPTMRLKLTETGGSVCIGGSCR